MTLQEILNAAYDDQGYQISGVISPNPSADVIARFTRWANEAVRDVLTRPRLAPLRHETQTITSIPGLAVYAATEAFDVIDTIVNQTNERRLRAMTRDWYRSIDPAERSEGSSYAWIEEGYRPVWAQPNAAPVYVSSTDPSDTTQTVYMRATTSDGGEHPEVTATLNGTTRVVVGIYPNYQTIRTITLSAPAAGRVEIFNDPVLIDGHALGAIFEGTTSAQFHLIRLWPTPSASEVYKIDGQTKILPLVHPTDVPVQIPALYHQALVDYVNYRAYEKNGDTLRAQVMRANYERRLNELTNKVEFSADFRPVRGGLGPDSRRWSNLGGYYPADYWGR